jgi:hypothetical protein
MLMNQFFRQDGPPVALSAQDFAVLDAYRQLGPQDACAADLYLFLRKSLARDPRLPTVYKIIGKLRDRGLLEDVRDDALSQSNGRPRRVYRLTSTGRAALSLADQMATYGSVDDACTA